MQKNFYIDNEKFFDELIEHRIKCLDRIDEELPQLSNYLGECFFKIASNFSNKPNFVGYSYKDDMVADAIENCIIAAHKFDPEISHNPFSYFTQITFFAFLRRIIKEKRQQDIKYKLISEYDLASIVDPDDEEMMKYIQENLQKVIDNDRKNVDNVSTKSKKVVKQEISLFD